LLLGRRAGQAFDAVAECRLVPLESGDGGRVPLAGFGEGGDAGDAVGLDAGLARKNEVDDLLFCVCRG